MILVSQAVDSGIEGSPHSVQSHIESQTRLLQTGQPNTYKEQQGKTDLLAKYTLLSLLCTCHRGCQGNVLIVYHNLAVLQGRRKMIYSRGANNSGCVNLF